MKKKNITKDLTLYFYNNYPKCINNKGFKKYTVYLGIGGNIGKVIQRFESLLKWFRYDTKIEPLQTSPILKNPPFGYLEQDYFYNAIVVIATDMHPLYLLKTLQKIENKFGRVRTFQDAPRTLDIDILFIQKYKQNIALFHRDLCVPHRGWMERESVLIPLSYIKNKCKISHKIQDKR